MPVKQLKVINIYDNCEGQKCVLKKEMLHNQKVFYDII